MTMPFSRITHSDIDTDALRESVITPRAGAIITFAGAVRNHDDGKSVSGIEYVAHPSAEDVIEEILSDFLKQGEVHAIALQHRVGTLGIGDIALYVAVSASHRSEAFKCCSDLVDRVKELLPVWKKQFLTDGSYEWSLCP